MASVWIYHQPNQEDQYFFNHLGSAFDKYTQNYEWFLLSLIVAFNNEDSEPWSEFLCIYNVYDIVK